MELTLKGLSLFIVTGERARSQAPLLHEATLVLDAQSEAPFPRAEEFMDVLAWPMPKPRLLEALGRAFTQRSHQRLSKDVDKHLAKATKDREELLAISAALSEEHETDHLLDMIGFEGSRRQTPGACTSLSPTTPTKERRASCASRWCRTTQSQ